MITKITDKRNKNIYTSRFKKRDIYTDNKTLFYLLWKHPEIAITEQAKTYAIPPGYAFRPDLISYMYYNTPYLSWIISIVNNIKNPMDKEEGYYEGRIITLPDIESVNGLL